jgi:subfamily B ATP-binding cassette protein MsbA
MKTYFRLLSFAKPIEKFAIPYILTTLFAILFSTLNFALIAPLLKTLFSDPDKAEALSAAKPSLLSIADTFTYYVQYASNHYGAKTTLRFVCITIIASVFLSDIFRYFSQRIMENLKAHTILKIRSTVFNSAMDLHLGYFSNERKGDIISKIANDVQIVQFTVTSTLQVVFKEPLTIICYLLYLFSTSPQLTFFSLLVVPVAGFIISRVAKRLKSQAIQSQQSFALMLSYLDEALSGIKIVKAYNATRFIKDRFNGENRRFTGLLRSMARRQQLASPISEFLSVTMVACIVYYGGTLIMDNETNLSPEGFIAYIAIFSQIIRPARAISDSFSNIHQGIAAGERVLDLIDTKPQIADAKDAVPAPAFSKSLSLKSISFAYGERTILDDVSLDIPAGKTIALVGPSGGGKSTLMDLIPRFIEPAAGVVLFDGIDLKTLTQESVRAQMGFVNQESILFNDSIFNNIAFGRPDATEEEVIAAARIANAHDFIIATNEGYRTNIGDRGVKLSGGQKQRLCIARAVLSNPPILLLDEATSALDTESEKLVQEALFNLMKNRTTLVIAHRLSTIQSADHIIVLDAGKIVEQGTHQYLVNRNGLYKKLIDMQAFQGE